MSKFNSGDKVYCMGNGILGIVMKSYKPTACKEQTKIRTPDGRMFHAPTDCFAYYKECNNYTMLIAKGNGRSMVIRNMAEMFNNKEVTIPRGNGKSTRDMEKIINNIDKRKDW